MLLLLVEESDVVRKRFRAILDTVPNLVVIEAPTVAEGMNRLGQMRPDVAVIDVQLSDGSGLEVLRQIKQQSPRTQVIMVSNQVYFRERCLSEGANFFFDTSLDLDYLTGLLRGLSLAEVV